MEQVHAKRLELARSNQARARDKVRAEMDGAAAEDIINKPNHYHVLDCPACGRAVESRDIQQAVVDEEGGMFAHDIATVLAYITRAPKKGTLKQDLMKAAKHLEWAIQNVEITELYAGEITEAELRHPLTAYDKW